MSAKRDIVVCEAAYPHLRHTNWTTGHGIATCPGIRVKVGDRSQPAGTRTKVLKDLRSIKADMGVLLSSWRNDALIYDAGMPHKLRARRMDEYPENSRDEWRRLARQCARMMGELDKIKQFAHERLGEMEDVADTEA